MLGAEVHITKYFNFSPVHICLFSCMLLLSDELIIHTEHLDEGLWMLPYLQFMLDQQFAQERYGLKGVCE